MAVTIYHNPRCGTSRRVLALLRERGIEPRIIAYLAEPPDALALRRLLKAMGMAPRALLRQREALYGTLGLADTTLGEAALIAAMAAHPILIERPIVETDKGVRLCRPPERVLDIL